MAHYRSQSGRITNGLERGTSPPPSAKIGQMWYNTNTGVLYSYTNDGTSSFWLDVSSGGIGMSDSRNVDIVGDTDPHLETSTTGAGLAIGSIYYNREGDRYFVCTNTTTNGNQWAGRYAGYGGVETMYKSGSNFQKIHTFLKTGTLHMDKTTTCAILVVAGGGGGGGAFNTPGGGGGGAGGFLTFATQSVTAGYHTCLVGNGGHGGFTPDSGETNTFLPKNGTNSQFGSLTAAVGGGNGGQYHQAKACGTGGSGGGGEYSTNAGAAGTGGQGNAGGNGIASSNQVGGGGGGSAGAGSNASGNNGGAGGTGTANAYRTGSNVTYAAGGGGGSGYTAGNGGAGGSSIAAINGGNHGNNCGGTGLPNTGHGGGGGSGRNGGTYGVSGGDGCSGIIVVKYQVA